MLSLPVLWFPARSSLGRPLADDGCSGPSFSPRAERLSAFFPHARGLQRRTVLYSPGRHHRHAAFAPVGVHNAQQHVVGIGRVELSKYLSNQPGFAVGTALSVLLARRRHCDVSMQHSQARMPKQVTATEDGRADYVDVKLQGRDWPEQHRLASQLEFLRAVGRLVSAPLTQTTRVLGNEADASTAFVSNTLNPSLAILQQLIDKGLRPYFEIVLLSEEVAEEAVSEPGGPSGSSAAGLRLEHVFALVDKSKDDKGMRRLSLHKALVIVEMKRHALVRLADWPKDIKIQPRALNKDSDARARNLLPQLLMYAHHWQCSRVYLSDYMSTIAMDIDFRAIGRGIPVPVAFMPCTETSKRPGSVYEAGARMAITYDVAQALRELGVASREKLGGAHPSLASSLLRYVPAEVQRKYGHS